MNSCDWIVCERTSRWAAALRVALAREDCGATSSIYEVRTWKELASRLETQPNGVAIAEVQRDQLGSALVWLATARRRFPRARFTAALDISSTDTEGHASSFRRDEQAEVVDALFEAGVAAVADSPRRLHAILALGRRHAALCAAQSQPSPRDNLSVVNAAWASLPWQDRSSAVG